MQWGLFCQIELIIMTIGLVASFIIYSYQNTKDSSFVKRVSLMANAIADALNSINSKKEEKK